MIPQKNARMTSESSNKITTHSSTIGPGSDSFCIEEYRIYHYYRLQTKLTEGNVFTPVCDSVHGGRGVSVRGSLSWGVSVQMGLYPGGISVQGGVYVQEGSLSGRPPRPTVKSGRYASFWNAFLFKTVFTRHASNTMMSNPLPDKEIISCI